MSFPAPNERQARILWVSVTALAVAVLLALLGLLFWGFGIVINRLSAVLLPLAVAGIIACLLDPVVEFFERSRMTRLRSIVLVFLLAIFLGLALGATILPQLLHEIGELVDRFPDYWKSLQTRFTGWLENSPRGIKARELWTEHGAKIQEWVTGRLPVVWLWVTTQAGKAANWLGFLVGLFLVPVYVFYFLLEKKRISANWTDYLPLQDSRLKQEAIFVIRSVNESLVVFFRGQVLVAMCVGALTAIGFFVIGLKYALLLGLLTGILGIIPYLGVMVSLVPAIALAVVQFGNWQVLLVVLVFVLVQMAEGLFISPKIIGDRVGLHPLTIIIAVMIGTTLLGGILGGVLAIPLTAALRTLMFRYIWRQKQAAPG